MTDEINEAPDWKKVEEIVGLPDYAVAFAIWPWPDGGWYAGVALTERDWAERQGLAARLLLLPEEMDPSFDIFDGFRDGLNFHGSSAADALDLLYTELGL